MESPSSNGSAIDADPRLQSLRARKSRFVWGLTIFSAIYYLLLPIGAGYFTDLYKVRLWGVLNLGLLFVLSQFLMAWVIAWYYARRARQFDAMADQIGRDAQRIGPASS
jgi:uncharacterized membrane protein (DUF485 family)